MTGSPKKSKEDVVYDATTVALASVPVVGTALAAVFESVFDAPIKRRRNEWIRRLEETVEELVEKIDGLSAQELSKNDRFVSASLHASQIALRTHQKAKLRVLQNALENIALHPAGNEDLETLYLRLIDELTPLHVRMLQFVSQPELDRVDQAWNQQEPDWPVNSGPAVIVARRSLLPRPCEKRNSSWIQRKADDETR